MSSEIASVFEEMDLAQSQILDKPDISFNEALAIWGLEVSELANLDFSDEDLNHAQLVQAILTGANLSRASLRHSDLSFASLKDCDLLLADLSGATLENVDASGANFFKALFAGANLNGVNWRDSILQNTNFSDTDLTEADFSYLRMEKVNFSRAVLCRAVFEGARLNSAIFKDANLAGADLSRCDLSGVNFERANLTGVSVVASTLMQANFESAWMDRSLAQNLDLEFDAIENSQHHVIICAKDSSLSSSSTHSGQRPKSIVDTSVIIERPIQENTQRSELAAQRRSLAMQYFQHYASSPTVQNFDESDLQDEGFVASFTKGLRHNEFGLLCDKDDYVSLVNMINQRDAENFDRIPRGISASNPPLTRLYGGSDTGSDIFWRGWESPRAGHYFDLQGPDADAVSLPAAPDLGSEEFIAEMAEVYALALLRDIPFSQIADLSGFDETTGIGVSDVLMAMGQLTWFTDSSSDLLTLQQRRRRAARRLDHGIGYSIDDPPDEAVFDWSNAFRGSSPGSKSGPYLSQFMLQGNTMNPATGENVTDATITYGRQVIDQKIEAFAAGHDYMVHWNAYVDVQNGADFSAQNELALRSTRRFIATPRDLATYVRYNTLYQPYLNACLFMLEESVFSFQQPVINPYRQVFGPGFPDGQKSTDAVPSRQGMAAFGNPHILSLVAEVAMRCLKAVQRQKFNYHRRGRPESIGGLLTLKGTENNFNFGLDVSNLLGGMTNNLLGNMLTQGNLGPLLALVDIHNTSRINTPGSADAHLNFSANSDPEWYLSAKKYLLPMAFAEGSPMHPSYGSGHAAVAGGCVTMLKAFFNTTDEQGESLVWPEGLRILQATFDGSELEDVDGTPAARITINGELNKMAANISIGHTMAGVNYYTDYYESLRMGERIATGILIEQMKQYNEPVEFCFESFDGDKVHILKIDYDFADPRVIIHDSDGLEVGLGDWWQRHSPAAEVQQSLNFARNTLEPEIADNRILETKVRPRLV